MATDEPIALKTQLGDVFGSLRMPSHPEQPVVVLIIAGSGPTDRDGNNTCFNGKNDSLKMLAEALADIGVASVRYDKRGIGASANAADCESELRFEDYVQDAVSWTSTLADDTRFSGVVILGHSEGSLIGMLAAANSPAKAYISIAGPSRPAPLILREQLRDKLPIELAERSGHILAALESGQTVEDVPTPLLALYRPSVQPYLISWFRYDPSAELRKLRIPCLILQGNTDTQVPDSDASSLHTAKPDSEMFIIDGMNHVLKRVPLDAARQLASYQDNSLPLVPELRDRLAGFLKPLVKSAKPCLPLISDIAHMYVSGPVQHVRDDCERILRSLPRWFGIESALIEYAEATDRLPTFTALLEGDVVGFITLESHSPTEWELHCIAVRSGLRGNGIGSALISAAEAWLKQQGALSVLVKTIAESHPSPEYQESRAFYQSEGFVAEKIIPDIWGQSNPCLQMRKGVRYG